MRAAAIIQTLTPNVASLGYALFLAINAAWVWGGVFPFLPMEFQTPQIIFQFFLAQSLVFAVSYFVSVAGVYFIPGPTRRFLVLTASIPYFIGWCFLIGAI
ncbi:MAG: LuxR family transcriptional regulator, partial [Raoultibacter sp.]